MTRRYWIETLGCPKNQVDSDKLVGTLLDDGMTLAADAASADLVVINTCAFIEAARQESIDTVLSLTENKKKGAKVVVTGCMAERYGDELAEALPEVDRVVGFGVPITLGATKPKSTTKTAKGTSQASKATKATTSTGKGTKQSALDIEAQRPIPSLDLLNLSRPKSTLPWAYIKIAEGCNRSCGFCAIPSFRGPQRSRSVASILDEVDQTGAKEIVLVAQDLASYGVDEPESLGAGAIVDLVKAVTKKAKRTRLLYLYPSDLTDSLVDAILRTDVPYFDLSLQHVSKSLLRRMRRWGDGDRFLKRIETIRSWDSEAAFRSNFIVGYPGETEEDHDQLLRFVEAAQLDWCGFFEFSREVGTYAYDLDAQVPASLMRERLLELNELQDRITARRRDALIGKTVQVLVDEPGIGRTHREAPEIDGIVSIPTSLDVGTFHEVIVVSAEGPDLTAELVS